MCSYAQTPTEITAADRYATPILVEPPRNLAELLEGRGENFSVEIKLRGTVTKAGQLTAPVFDAPAGNEKLVKALERELQVWRFRPEIHKTECHVIEGEMLLSVWFEVINGRPSMSVSTPKYPAPAEKAESTTGTPAKSKIVPRVWATAPAVAYPRKARVAGTEGRAQLLLRANWDGKIVEASVWTSIPDDEFGKAAMSSLAAASMLPNLAESDKSKLSCISVPFQFCLTNRVIFPSVGCASAKK
ncbi:MAG: TonB family protein [Usitatibacteraceae bacterium]